MPDSLRNAPRDDGTEPAGMGHQGTRSQRFQGPEVIQSVFLMTCSAGVTIDIASDDLESKQIKCPNIECFPSCYTKKKKKKKEILTHTI